METITFANSNHFLEIEKFNNMFKVLDSYQETEHILNESEYLALKSLITNLEKVSGNYLTTEMGEISVNLKEKKIFITVGPEGIFFLNNDTLKSLKEKNISLEKYSNELLNSDKNYHSYFDNLKFMTEFLNNEFEIEFEIECFADETYIYVGNIVSLANEENLDFQEITI